MSATKLPACPELSVITRWGWADKDVKRKTKLYSDPKKLILLNLWQSGNTDEAHQVPVRDRVICVYDHQLSQVERILRSHKISPHRLDDLNVAFELFGPAAKGVPRTTWEFIHLLGARFLTRPSGKTYGEDYQFMEHDLIDNPGYIKISDGDVLHALSSNRKPGQKLMCVEDFAAEVRYALQNALRLDLKVWGIRHQNNTGAPLEGIARQPDERDVANGFFRVGPTEYPRCMIFLKNDAVGVWQPWNQLEDRSRSLSEAAASGPNSVGMYVGCAIRYPSTANSPERYYQNSEWMQNCLALKAQYPQWSIVKKATTPSHGRVWSKRRKKTQLMQSALQF